MPPLQLIILIFKQEISGSILRSCMIFLPEHPPKEIPLETIQPGAGLSLIILYERKK